MDDDYKQEWLAEQHKSEDEAQAACPFERGVMPEVDIVLRVAKGHGIIPIILRDNKEVYRGEFQDTLGMALLRAEDRLKQLNA